MNWRQLLYLFLSFLIVAGAQPDWSALACIFASASGYALFWKGMLFSRRYKTRFLLAMVWFAAVQAVQVSWFAADQYVGGYIYFFLAILYLGLGVQFGLISLFVKKDLSLFRILGISGGWALFEWTRLHLMSGYSWNPVGIALSGTLYGMQIASVFGVFGMGFWIFLTNLMALGRKHAVVWIVLAATPYVFGWIQVAFHSKQMNAHPDSLSALLLQTALYPEHKLPLNGSTPLSPDKQWERIFQMLQPFENTRPDLIVLSEAAVPYGAHYPIYPKEIVDNSFHSFFDHTPSFLLSSGSYVDNLYWVRRLANHFSADVVIGLEDFEIGNAGHVENAYNAAFLVSPFSNQIMRYEKRILVPMGEYIPFDWCRSFLAKYGIADSFSPGEEAKVFKTRRAPIGISICYEETYGHLMRESRSKGAELLINLTNDVWYPRSRLPIVHFFHGRLRAVEAGVPLLRSCNTGVTCGVDSLGRLVGMLKYECAQDECPAEALALSLPLYTYHTFYSRCGDFPVILLSGLCFSFLCARMWYKRKLFSINDLEVSPLRKN